MNIAVVGAGNGGRNILHSFSKIDGININIIIDKNLSAPGIELARELGIKYSADIGDIRNENTDIIIEVTGSDKVAAIIQEMYGRKCKIIDSQAALLIMSLVQSDMEKVEMLNTQVKAINNTTTAVQDQLQDISDSIENIHNVIERLLQFTKVSDEYIFQMDEIIQYVNRVAQQTKVLGINATIEAMRAGENGRTFAIVAKEMQVLANDSEENSKGIREILSKLSVEIKNVNQDVENLRGLSRVQIDASGKMNTAIEALSNQTSNN